MDHLGLNLHKDLNYIPYLHGIEYKPKGGFHAFPEKAGWKINERYDCEPMSDYQELLPFLQAWLFFGLLDTVLSDSIRDLDVYQEFTTGEGYINTESLPRHLKSWKEYEENQWEDCENFQECKKAYRVRMVRIQMALDHARGVVRRYCSFDGTPPTTGYEYALTRTYGKETFDLVSLSLIVLGETLSNAKAKIVEQIGFKIRGWHGDAAEVWGTSRLVKDKMKAEWCAMTLHALEGQFCGNTTGLLAAFSLQPFDNHDHKACTTELCKLSHVEDESRYEVKHQESCDKRNCDWVGTKPEELLAIIRKGAIPLLLLKNGGSSVSTAIKLTDTSKCKDYATISHVWSDGYGNPKENKIHRCQLEFLRSVVYSVEKNRHRSKVMAFWIDTLAIPVGQVYSEERKIAIGRIHETFVRSRYTIVIDKGLCQNWAGKRYHETAMRILASGWMRRLWTLQEAYLSDKIFFKFRDHNALDLEELEAMYPSANDTLDSSIPSMARSYFESLVGTARKARIHEMIPRKGVNLVGSVWKATQWRTTTRKEHEVLALATLFGLNTDRSEAAESINQSFTSGKGDAESLESNMCTLLELLEKVYPGSIPAGIIFVPGKKLSKKGFGWAPATWMSGYAADYPDPLALVTPAARLVPGEGLHVELPGIILHSIPGTNPLMEMAKGFSLRFPVDNTLAEWYEVKYADEVEQPTNHAATQQSHSNEYAIILPRWSPGEIEEIALMVEMGQTFYRSEFGSNRETLIINVAIEFRVWIRRITWREENMSRNHYGNPNSMLRGPFWGPQNMGMDTASRPVDGSEEGTHIFGEVLGFNQKWCVGKEHSQRKINNEAKHEGGQIIQSAPIPEEREMMEY